MEGRGALFRSDLVSEIVDDWEGNNGASIESKTGVDHLSVIVVEEESPETGVPASTEGSPSTVEDYHVPVPSENILKETGGGDAHYKSEESKNGKLVLLSLTHLLT